MGCVVFDGAIPDGIERRPARPGLSGRGVQRARRGRCLHGRLPARLAARRAAASAAAPTPMPAARWWCRATAARRRWRAGTSCSTSSRTARTRGGCAKTRAGAPAPRDHAHAALGRAGASWPSTIACSSTNSRAAWRAAPQRIERLQAPGRRGARGAAQARRSRAWRRHDPRRPLRRGHAARADRHGLVGGAAGRAAGLAAAGVRSRRAAGPGDAHLAGRARRQVPGQLPPGRRAGAARRAAGALAELQGASVATFHEFLVEVIPPRDMPRRRATRWPARWRRSTRPASAPTGGSCRPPTSTPSLGAHRRT